MTDFQTLLTELKDGIFTITLNRPEVYNAFNEQLTTDLLNAFKEAAKSDEIRCVVLTGAGKAFCSGQDLKDAPSGTGQRSLRDSLERRYNPLIRAMRNLPKPIIAAINGVAAGAGCSLDQSRKTDTAPRPAVRSQHPLHKPERRQAQQRPRSRAQHPAVIQGFVHQRL